MKKIERALVSVFDKTGIVEFSKALVGQFNIEILSTGGGVAPIRRPLWSCTDNGIMFVGDSACQVNPLHGGGIDPSMRAGYYAALTAVLANDMNDFTINSLWEYNYNVMTNFGAEFASLDLLRMGLQVFSNEDLNFGLEQDLLSGNEILELVEESDRLIWYIKRTK